VNGCRFKGSRVSSAHKRKGPQREEAYEGLYQVLVLQKLHAGDRLREIEWSGRLGVNRAALREALARLEADGFVQKGVGGGYCVPRLCPNDILEILELRAVLEGGAIERICRLKRNTARDLKKLRTACDKLARLVDRNDLAGVPEVDRRFHDAIIEASGNRRLVKVYGHAPLPLIYPEKYTKKGWLVHTAPRTLADHRAILAAILEGNVPGAREWLHKHLLERYATTVGKALKYARSRRHIRPAAEAQTDRQGNASNLSG